MNRGYDKNVYYTAIKEGKQSNINEDKSNTNNNKGSCEIIGNINSKGNKIFHMPGQRDYENTVAEKMFCTKEVAEAAGFIPAKQ